MKRIFAFLGATAVCVVFYVFLLSLMRGSPYDIGSVVAALILATALVVLNRRLFRAEGSSLAEIGFDAPKRRLIEFGAAFLAGCGVVALWTLPVYLLLSARWQPYEGFNPAGAVSRIAFCLFNNTGEELAYRGYLLRKLEQQFGPAIAVISTSVLFALLHVQAGLPWLSAATIVFTSGVLFAVLLLRWRSLPLVIGFHVATNVGQELIGLRVTDLTVMRPLFGSVGPAAPISTLALAALCNLLIAAMVAASWRKRTLGLTSE